VAFLFFGSGIFVPELGKCLDPSPAVALAGTLRKAVNEAHLEREGSREGQGPKDRDRPRQNPLTGPFELRKPLQILFVSSDSCSFASIVDPSFGSFQRCGSVDGALPKLREPGLGQSGRVTTGKSRVENGGPVRVPVLRRGVRPSASGVQRVETVFRFRPGNLLEWKRP
jgi:hypothetical protein